MAKPGPEKGTISKYDPAEVVRIALEAYRNNQSMAVVVAGHFGLQPRSATSMLSRLRRDGYAIPNQAGFNNDSSGNDMGLGSPCGTPGAYQRHIKAGQEPCQACKDDKARRARLRRAGISSARPEPGYDGPTNTYMTFIRLMCDTCGDYVDSVSKLTHHTLQVHGRPPTRDERTPR